jgi:SAM-dependent methyltransferase
LNANDEIRRQWDAAAPGWEAERATISSANAPVTAALVAAVDPQPGNTVLDLASGPGDLVEALAGRVARIVATDLSPAMVEVARRRGIPNAEHCVIEHRVMDMQAIDLPDASVDGVVSRFGYMLVPDSALALRETRRVLRPGGALAFATWAPAKRNPWATAFGPPLIERGLMEPPVPGQPGQFALGDPDRIDELVRTAGFAAVDVSEVDIEYRFASWDEYRRVVTNLGSVLRQKLAELDGDVGAEIDAAARTRLEPFRDGDGYVLPGVALVTRAV